MYSLTYTSKGPCSLSLGGTQMVETEFIEIMKQHIWNGPELNFNVSTTPWKEFESQMLAKHSYSGIILRPRDSGNLRTGQNILHQVTSSQGRVGKHQKGDRQIGRKQAGWAQEVKKSEVFWYEQVSTQKALMWNINSSYILFNSNL